MSSSLDVGSLRVTELRKELRSRGLSAQGDKAELATRLRAALSIDELDLTALDEEHDSALPLHTSSSPLASPTSPGAPLALETIAAEAETPAAPRPVAKKIVLNRAPVTAPVEISSLADDSKPAAIPTEIARPPEPKQTRLVADSKSRLEMRAKRFGLPLGGDAIKEARKARFGGNASAASAASTTIPISTSALAASIASLEVLKKRAERFGCSVSKIMVDVENKEKLERRKEKFGTVKS